MVLSPQWDNGATVNAGARRRSAPARGLLRRHQRRQQHHRALGQQGLSTVLTDTANGRWVAQLTAQRSYSASASLVNGPNDFTFSFIPGTDADIHPSFLTGILDTGSSVTLQANNDITVTNAISANNGGGNGEALTLQAGRSILLNASITTDNGDLNLFANEDLAAGVVDKTHRGTP